jgi:hypothetical protein
VVYFCDFVKNNFIFLEVAEELLAESSYWEDICQREFPVMAYTGHAC